MCALACLWSHRRGHINKLHFLFFFFPWVPSDNHTAGLASCCSQKASQPACLRLALTVGESLCLSDPLYRPPSPCALSLPRAPACRRTKGPSPHSALPRDEAGARAAAAGCPVPQRWSAKRSATDLIRVLEPLMQRARRDRVFGRGPCLLPSVLEA